MVITMRPPKYKFQSTLPVRGATQFSAHLVKLIAISIHAPREGSDTDAPHGGVEQGISIHAPREGSDMGMESDSTRA